MNRLACSRLNAVGAAIALAFSSQSQALEFTWSGGDYLAVGLPNPLGSSDVVNAVEGPNKSFTGSIVNNGRFNWMSTNSMFFGSSSSLRNNGLFDFRADSWLRPGGAGSTLDNAGVLRKSGGTGDLLVDTLLVNRSGATLDASSGGIHYRASGTLEAGSLFTGAGTHVFETVGSYTFRDHFSGADNNLRLNRGTFISGGSQRLDPRTNLTWSGGVLQGDWSNGSGRTMTAVAGTFSKTISGSFVNDGRIDWTTTDTLALDGSGTTLRNNGVIDHKANGWIRPFDTNITLDNAGVLRKSGGTGDLLVDTLLVNRSGATLDASSGGIHYRASGTLEAGSLFTGAGTHVFETVGSYIFRDHFSGADNNLRLNRGTFISGGSQRLDPRTNLTWSGGVLQGDWSNGSGRTMTAVAGTFSKTISGSFVNDGRIDWTTTDTLALDGSGTTLRNNGVIDHKANGWIRPFDTNITLDNAGVLRKSGGTGDLLVDTLLVNRSGATLDASSGGIHYRASGTLEAGSLFTGAGTHVFETVGSYTFRDHFSGADNNLRLNRGTFISGGSQRLDPRTNLTWSGGVLQGDWSNGSGRTMTAVAGTFSKTISGSFVNDGRIDWTTTDTLALDGGGTTLRNNGVLDHKANGWIRPFDTNITVDNAGVLRKSAGTGSLLIDTQLTNTGAIESLSGNIRLPSNWRNDGTLRGDAAFQTLVLTNAGDVAPGLPDPAEAIATLTLTGALIETAAGTLSFDVTSAGLSDMFNVTGAVTFDGVVRVFRFGDYAAQLGDTFRVMNFAGFSGGLDDVQALGFGGGVEFEAVYAPTYLELRVAAVPEPHGWALMTGGLLMLSRLRRRARAALGC